MAHTSSLRAIYEVKPSISYFPWQRLKNMTFSSTFEISGEFARNAYSEKLDFSKLFLKVDRIPKCLSYASILGTITAKQLKERNKQCYSSLQNFSAVVHFQFMYENLNPLDLYILTIFLTITHRVVN